jgi:hypothetical protein
MTTLRGNPPPLLTDVVASVRQAAESATKRPVTGGFSYSVAGTAERLLAPLLGLYLGYAVVRLPEVFTQLAVPHLPMILMLAFLAALVLAIPSEAWRGMWHRSPSLRLVALLAGIAVITAPFGIWPASSYAALRTRYFLCATIFLCCMVFLRDRRNLRIAISIYVLCVAAVSLDVIRTYDPNAPVFDDNGQQIDPEIVAANPDMHRLKAVGVSLDPNDFGAVLCTTFPLALWLSVGSLRRRVFWSGIAILLVAAVVPTQSRGSELGLVAAMAVVLSVGARGWRRWLSIAMIAGCVGLFLMMASGLGAAGRFTDFSQNDYNVAGNSGRWYFWKQGIVWMIKRPWGYGIENYPTFFGIMNDGTERSAHSTWVQYGMELGVAGLAAFVALCAASVNGLRRARTAAAAWRGQYPAADDEGVLAGYMLALLAGVLVSASFLSNAYYPLLYMSLGIVAAVLLGNPLPATGTQSTAAKADGAPIHRRRLRSFPSPATPG